MEAALFARMPPADQLEGLQVLAELRRWGFEGDRDLLLAGLLHDMGKAQAPARVRYRMAATLLEGSPRLLRSIGRHSPVLRVLANHAALGAAMARRAELPLDVQRLIALHHT
ncbi:MAG: HDIG domain-containing metalloprotein, partial [Chloroflexota bacterium]